MRKLLLLCAISAFSFLKSSAQIQKNQWYGGVEFGKGISGYSGTYGKISLGYGLNRHSMVGIVFNSEFTSDDLSKYGINSKFKSSGFGGGVFYNQFLSFKKGGKWGLYANATVSYNSTKLTMFNASTGDIIQRDNSSKWRISVTPGIFFKPSNRLMFLANLGGAYWQPDVHGLETTSTFGKQFNIGMIINLGGGKKHK